VVFHRTEGFVDWRSQKKYEKDAYVDFGGSAKSYHNTCQEVAAEEGYEETMGIIPPYRKFYKDPIANKKEGVALLRGKIKEAAQHAFCVTLQVQDRIFKTYFIDVTEWVKNEADRLKILRKLYTYAGVNLAKFIHNKFEHNMQMNNNPHAAYCEKRKFAWLTKSNIKIF